GDTAPSARGTRRHPRPLPSTSDQRSLWSPCHASLCLYGHRPRVELGGRSCAQFRHVVVSASSTTSKGAHTLGAQKGRRDDDTEEQSGGDLWRGRGDWRGGRTGFRARRG